MKLQDKLLLTSLLIITLFISGCTKQSETPENTAAEIKLQKVGELWWESIFTSNWDALFSNTVDKNNNPLDEDCQNKIKAAYASFAGATYSLDIENTSIPCASVTGSPLPIPSLECTAVKYTLDTGTKFGKSTAYLFFIKTGNDWKVQIDCKWYSGY
jgi:hypothetical protein